MIPFKEDQVKNKFWRSEKWDENLPSPGFITDFVLHTRGIETPSKFSVWIALWLISSITKRQCHFKQFPKGLFSNLFVFLVGPPRVCGKGYGIAFGERLIEDFHTRITDPKIQIEKRANILRSRATPESFRIALASDQQNLVVGSKVIPINRGSQLCLITDELATFLGPQKYNTGLVSKLTQLYDCKVKDDDLTIGAGWNKFENIYFTWMAAATKNHLEESIPTQAFGGGFMSRVILVYQPVGTRIYPDPIEVVDGPTEDDLLERLAWIATQAYGEYNFSKKAWEWYNEWYFAFRKTLERAAESDDKCMTHRMGTHLKKVSMLLRLQRYEVGNEVGIRDLLEAKRILDGTFHNNEWAISDVGASKEIQALNMIATVIKNCKKVSRTKLIRTVSKKYNVDMVNSIVYQLVEEKKVKIKLGDHLQGKPSRNGTEVYSWVRN